MKKLITLIFISLLAISCKKTETPVVPVAPVTPAVTEDRIFSNVLIIGNSITRASPTPEIGWNNNWGMAATKAEFDYVHLLTAKFKALNPAVKLNTVTSGEFEVGYPTFDFVPFYAEVKATKPDLLILRFGENIVQDNPELTLFDDKYTALVNYFKEGNPKLKILAVGSFWSNPVVDACMKKRSKFVTLTPLLNDINNQAFNDFTNHSVQIHPSDKGMKVISDIIWEGLKGL